MNRNNAQNKRRSISVIIVSYRRRQYLLKVLECLQLQTRIPDQVIVVDASPAEEQLKNPEFEHLSGLEYIRYAESGNVSRQRNTGITRATGDIVLFLDDDVEFGESLIEDYFKCFEETQADGISGLILLPGQAPGGKPFRPDTVLGNPGGSNYLTFEGVIESHVICTANFAVHRQVLLDVGGFDEAVLGTCDDVDLGWRLAQAGFLILHHNRPRLLHLRAPASGARSSNLGSSWQYSNLFYLQLRHFWVRHRRWLLLVSLWQHCRPSRHWLTPWTVANCSAALYRGYLEACRRLEAGPKLMPRLHVTATKPESQ